MTDDDNTELTFSWSSMAHIFWWETGNHELENNWLLKEMWQREKQICLAVTAIKHGGGGHKIADAICFFRHHTTLMYQASHWKSFNMPSNSCWMAIIFDSSDNWSKYGTHTTVDRFLEKLPLSPLFPYFCWYCPLIISSCYTWFQITRLRVLLCTCTEQLLIMQSNWEYHCMWTATRMLQGRMGSEAYKVPKLWGKKAQSKKWY